MLVLQFAKYWEKPKHCIKGLHSSLEYRNKSAIQPKLVSLPPMKTTLLASLGSEEHRSLFLVFQKPVSLYINLSNAAMQGRSLEIQTTWTLICAAIYITTHCTDLIICHHKSFLTVYSGMAKSTGQTSTWHAAIHKWLPTWISCHKVWISNLKQSLCGCLFVLIRHLCQWAGKLFHILANKIHIKNTPWYMDFSNSLCSHCVHCLEMNTIAKSPCKFHTYWSTPFRHYPSTLPQYPLC